MQVSYTWKLDEECTDTNKSREVALEIIQIRVKYKLAFDTSEMEMKGALICICKICGRSLW